MQFGPQNGMVPVGFPSKWIEAYRNHRSKAFSKRPNAIQIFKYFYRYSVYVFNSLTIIYFLAVNTFQSIWQKSKYTYIIYVYVGLK